MPEAEDKIMLAGTFQSKLRKLNPRLRIYAGNTDSSWPAGIYHVVRGEYTEICGIDKNVVPEHPTRMPNGALLKGGWRRALKILLKKGLIDRHEAQKEFSTHLGYKTPRFKSSEEKFRVRNMIRSSEGI